MKTIRILLMSLALSTLTAGAANPFFSPYKTPHQTFPFDKVRLEHILPALEKGFTQLTADVKKITGNKAPATFENTIVALEKAGGLVHDVQSVFGILSGSEMDEALMEISQKVTLRSAEESNKINLNEALFARVKAVYDEREKLNLRVDQMKLLTDTYESFVRNGAALKGADRDRFKELSIKLSTLEETFQQNTLKSTNSWEKLITDESLLKGLPDMQREAALNRAKAKSASGWLFDLSAPSYLSIMKYAENRDLRKELYVAYNRRGMSGGYDNRPVIREIVNTRLELAKLLGYASYADYVLTRRMASNPAGVFGLLDQLAEAYTPVAKAEVAAVQGFAIGKEGRNIDIQPWDWSYYSEQLKSARYSINDEILRPYFKLENVQKGVFGLATRLYGITFKKNPAIPIWNKEVEAWDVLDKDGSYLAVLYTDFFPRKTKQQGAWMNNFNEQHRMDGKEHRPHVSITMNFTRPTSTKPALLTYDELTTFLHEFGHALHGILSDVTYRSQAGTSVYRDFVELPSQVMENWANRKEFLDEFALHYQTGEKIPFELVEKIREAENFNVGYGCLRQLSFGYLDMAWNGSKVAFDGDPLVMETKATEKVTLLPMPEGAMVSTSFGHIFSGGYAAGYYSYKWAEVLDADAYEWLTRKQVFDPEAAASFRENVLSKGGTEHPMILYKRFRGQEPGIDALLRRNGIIR